VRSAWHRPSLSGGLDPTRLPGADADSVLVREEMRVEHGHDGRVEIVHGTSGYDQGDRDRRIDAQRNLRSDREHGRLAPEAFGGDAIASQLMKDG
jgi:hypothetical protein